MATYRAVESWATVVQEAGSYLFLPDERTNYTFVAAQSWPRVKQETVEEYVWVGPGGDTDNEHAYWG